MKLSIDGGAPVRQSDYPVWPQYGIEEEEALLRSLRQGQWWRALPVVPSNTRPS